jgi:hypothetical protein
MQAMQSIGIVMSLVLNPISPTEEPDVPPSPRDIEIVEVVPVFQTLTRSPLFLVTLKSRHRRPIPAPVTTLESFVVLELDGVLYRRPDRAVLGQEISGPLLPGAEMGLSLDVERFLEGVHPPLGPGRHTVAFCVGAACSPETRFIWRYNARYLDLLGKEKH